MLAALSIQWTTDADVENAISGIGVQDLVEVRFHENRANGQSKGFCVITVGSEISARQCMDKLPKKELHGQTPIVTFTSKQALNQVKPYLEFFWCFCVKCYCTPVEPLTVETEIQFKGGKVCATLKPIRVLSTQTVLLV